MKTEPTAAYDRMRKPSLAVTGFITVQVLSVSRQTPPLPSVTMRKREKTTCADSSMCAEALCCEAASLFFMLSWLQPVPSSRVPAATSRRVLNSVASCGFGVQGIPVVTWRHYSSFYSLYWFVFLQCQKWKVNHQMWHYCSNETLKDVMWSNKSMFGAHLECNYFHVIIT